jgi:hypothetical protein
MEDNDSLRDAFFALPPERRRSVHVALCEHALEIWKQYLSAADRVEYIETVVGTRQHVDKQLPFDAVEAVKQGSDSKNVATRYREPIVAMQDEDLVFPESITFAYYAIYNLFKKYVQQGVIDDWLIINQALASETDAKLWSVLLKKAIQSLNQK